MRKHEADKAKNQLAQIIKDQIATDPFERGGVQWARVHQEPLADHLNVAVKTLHRWTGTPPFQREVALIDGVKMTLLRVLADGETSVMTPQRMANVMRKIWDAKVGTTLTQKQHGCLVGLAENWPHGHQIEIFKCVLNDWQMFAGANKHAMHLAAADMGHELTSDKNDGVYVRHFKFPNVTYLRRFQIIGPAVYAMELQKAGKPVPPAVNAIYQSLKAFG